MSNKKVSHLIPAENINMGGIIVKQALPTQRVPEVDPFLLLHHADFSFREDAPAIHQGIGPHPHRGFSPVTFVIRGEIHHRDSRGHSQIAKGGEVQWMHAGAGIIHSERPSQALVDRKGRLEVIQLWINSPSSSKMKPPVYQYLPEEQMPMITTEEDPVRTMLIAGSYADQVGKIQTESDLLILWAHASGVGDTIHKIPSGYNTMLYVIHGEVSIRGYGKVGDKHLVVFDDVGADVSVTASADAEYLVLSGKPIEEKITQQGPFVMNTQTEILQAMRDYQMGKMGILIEE